MRLFALILPCALWTTMLLWWFWEYVDAVLHRRPGESYLKALQRGYRGRALNQQARAEMLGGRLVTGVASLASSLLTLLTLLWIVEGRAMGYFLAIYLAMGLVVASRLNFKAHRSWKRLGAVDRLSLRWTHAWLWPVHLLTKRSQPPS